MAERGPQRDIDLPAAKIEEAPIDIEHDVDVWAQHREGNDGQCRDDFSQNVAGR